ncbi:MAG: LLM class flavin-dependent oxidoreductase [Chitinophagaceae bacterium]
MQLKLSILDQTPVRKGFTAMDSVNETVKLARMADGLGYTRYWLSEHHNTITLAGASPEIFMARLGAETSRIRLGSGGIMLPNHSALKVAEDFRLLEAMYPNRIDLGVGRAPGGDRATSRLLNPSNQFDPQEYVRQIQDVLDFFSEHAGAGNMDGRILAIPSIPTSPDMWALTSSGESAFIAAHFGMGLSYAKFINPTGAAEAIEIYREKFRPSEIFPEPQTSIGIFGFCSNDPEKVEQAKKLYNYRLLSFEKGDFNRLYSFDDIKDYQFTAAEKQRLKFHEGRYIIGNSDYVKEKMTALATGEGTNEIIVATFADSQEDRLESYRLMAKIFL